ncbi:haloacid dehalogenase type II [Massilia sp. LXY-6]|uniref:haloacid dehalogenase type II n=1 Tax=Massilia sp. LXY-6 TaxID=3379823 RepID=UPI003EDF1AA9
MPPTTDRPALLLFDINETLLDLAPLRASIERILPGGAELWFTTLLQHATAMSLAGRFAPLPEIGAAALRMLAEGRGVKLSPQQAQMAIAPIARLPAHPDVAAALARLRAAGFRLAALSNSTTAGLRAQLAHAGLAPLFDAQFSVQDFGVYKPHPAVYLGATARMRVAPGQAMLVAAHGWDVAGAGWAGLRSAFVCRGDKRPFPLAEQPGMVVRDLSELADRLGA